jgi:hypothetical protein
MVTPPQAEDVSVYSWEEAIDHIDEGTATVTGPIIGTSSEELAKGLRMGGPQGPLLVFSGLEPPPEDLYLGHTVSVTVSNINAFSVFNDYLPPDIDMTKTKKVSDDMTTIFVRLYITDLSQIEIID